MLLWLMTINSLIKNNRKDLLVILDNIVQYNETIGLALEK
jgi:hypothetical protein